MAPAGAREKKDSLAVAELETAAESWLLDGEARLSPKTVVDRRNLCKRLLWFLRTFEHGRCDRASLTAFFAYLRTAHERPEGRWGTPGKPREESGMSARNLKRTEGSIRPRTAANYYRWLRTLFLFLVADSTLDESPLKHVKAPVYREDQPQPFTDQQVEALLAAARNGPQPKRDEAILLLFLDTGARSAEVCRLKVGDFQPRQRQVKVRGKGDFHRLLPLSPETCRAILRHLAERLHEEDEPLFESFQTGDHLTPTGMRILIRKIGKRAGVTGVRCSPHTWRHTSGYGFIKNGGQQLALQRMFGHSSLAMTNRYVALAQADVAQQHALASPVSNLKKKR